MQWLVSGLTIVECKGSCDTNEESLSTYVRVVTPLMGGRYP